ncbi:MAG: hypothetical protein E6G75_21235 [Alphaproteobacteria bacterium]|nr:MAG: hypothetical protein E6G75_21235 [Alphaproteobacteria bacterium]
MVDAPLRISTPGHSTSGADGVGECGCVTPGVAPEKKLVKRLVNEGELSDDPTLEASEQPDSMAALTISAPARHQPRSRSKFPGRIEITRLFSDGLPPPNAYTNQFVATPRLPAATKGRP